MTKQQRIALAIMVLWMYWLLSALAIETLDYPWQAMALMLGVFTIAAVIFIGDK